MPLVIAGDGPQLEELRGPGVHLTGRVAPAELDALRREAAVAIVPSRYAEILPLAALEAMAAGLPVVAARAGGLAEIVPEEGLYPPGDVAALAERGRGAVGRRRRRRARAGGGAGSHRAGGCGRRAARGVRRANVNCGWVGKRVRPGVWSLSGELCRVK